MPHYRLYYIDGGGRIANVEEFSARDDVEAVRLSRDDGAMKPSELWCRDRMVAPVPGQGRRA